MSTFKLQITSARLGINDTAAVRDEVRELVRLIKCPVSYYNRLQEERQPDETIKQTFERLEEMIEQKTGLRHYNSYEAFRVAKHRIQAEKGIGNKQATLFD